MRRNWIPLVFWSCLTPLSISIASNHVVPDQFPTIQQAVDAAAPGDSIIVKAGSYPPFTVSGKPLSILGAGSASVKVGNQVAAAVRIQGIPAGAQLTLAGMTLNAWSGLFEPCKPALDVSSNSGHLAFSDLRIEATDGLCSGAAIVDSDFAMVSSCKILPVLGGAMGPVPYGLDIRNSTVWLMNSEVRGGSGPFTPVCTAFFGSAGVKLKSSTLYFANSTVQGGNGGCTGICSWGIDSCAAGAPGIEAADSTMKIVSGSIVGGVSPGTYSPLPVPGPPGIKLTGSSFALIATATSVTGGWGSSGSTQGEAVLAAPPSQFVKTSYSYPILSSTQPVVSPGETILFQVTGYPGSSVRIGVSLSLGPIQLFPPIDGAFILDRASIAAILSASLDATGQASVAVVAPSSPSLVGQSLFVQSLVMPPGALGAVSNPFVVTTKF